MTLVMKKMVGFPEFFTSKSLILLLFFLQLLTLGSAQFSVIGPAEPILALEGKDVELPCHLKPKMNAESMEVRWFRSQPSDIVHLYENRKDRFQQQMEEYHKRTKLVTETMDYGSVAVRVYNVTVSDEGQYRCSFYNGQVSEVATLELQVVAPLFPMALSLMVALGVTIPLLGLLIAGGLYLIWKQNRYKGKEQEYSCDMSIIAGKSGRQIVEVEGRQTS
ncbi:myelin-oligodendrocyte glycoprotein-like isoform X1 [Ornithorhynchus anatinus]|uniref:myelin-oligodendrocyte glycoprotein-like isoform X1 n=2 Tax=Ornithorhynchus anatinus TaxID=9258 RepID=UPI0010A812AF|nr:myelin-oligodendrocyte glycoprotein-like isoform X1 [Ornithorhynchus anatinus]